MSEIIFPSKVQISSTDYHKHAAIGSTSLKKILRSVAHYQYEKENPKEPTKAMRFGTAFHTAALEPKLFKESVVTIPEFSGTGSRALKDQWMIQNDGKTIISDDEMTDIMGMLKSLSGHKTASKLLADGFSEESFFWQDHNTGIKCKCRSDRRVVGNIIVDLKSTESADLPDFQRTILNYRYHLSGAFYLEGISNVLGQAFQKFVLIAVEKVAPYKIQVFELDEATIEKGKELYMRALQRLKNAQDAGTSPGYSEDIVPINLPPWGWSE